jgi:hypothetical protein
MEYSKMKIKEGLILSREEVFSAKEKLREKARNLTFEEKIELWLKWRNILEGFEKKKE